MKLVPRKPTLEMLEEGYKALSKIYPPIENDGWAIGQLAVWEAMYDVAPDNIELDKTDDKL